MLQSTIYCFGETQHEEFTDYPICDGYENNNTITTDKFGDNDEHQRFGDNDIHSGNQTLGDRMKYKRWAFSGIFIFLVNSVMLTIFYKWVL